jgi:hypothetical protein
VAARGDERGAGEASVAVGDGRGGGIASTDVGEIDLRAGNARPAGAPG